MRRPQGLLAAHHDPGATEGAATWAACDLVSATKVQPHQPPCRACPISPEQSQNPKGEAICRLVLACVREGRGCTPLLYTV